MENETIAKHAILINSWALKMDFELLLPTLYLIVFVYLLLFIEI